MLKGDQSRTGAMPMSVNRHPRLLTAGITFRDLVISGIDELPGLDSPGDDEPGVWYRAGHDDGGNCVTSPTSRTES